MERLATRLESELVDEVVKSFGSGTPATHQFDEARHGVRASSSYLLINQMADRGRDLELSFIDGAIRFKTAPRLSALEVAIGLLGFFAKLVRAYLETFRGRFEAVANELEKMGAEVEHGMPSLVSFELDPNTGEATKYRFTDLPLVESAALREVLRETERLGQDPAADISAVRLLAARLHTYVRFGDASADSAIIDGETHEGLDMLPTASLQLDLELLGSEPIDYWAPISYTLEQGQYRQNIFTGAVQEATVDGKKVQLDCEGATDLTEHTTGGMVAVDIEPAELVRSMILQAGWPEDLLKLSEPVEERPEEDFEVLAPLQGITVDSEVSIGKISIVPKRQGEAALVSFDLDPDSDVGAGLSAEFENASSYARAVVRTALPNEAEDRGLAAIDTAVAWLVTRGRYGMARLPSEKPQAFSRQSSLRSPERGPVVLVRGTDTDRRWLRWPDSADRAIDRELASSSSTLDPTLPEDLPINDRQALLALRRAASEADRISQAQALWQAIESYTAGSTAEKKLFSKDILDHLRERIPNDLDDKQKEKLKRAIDTLNEPPASLRLKWCLKRDGVPITEPELELLKRLRDTRNDVIHGRAVENPPTRAETNYGISLVSRMLVYRIARRGDAPTDR